MEEGKIVFEQRSKKFHYPLDIRHLTVFIEDFDIFFQVLDQMLKTRSLYSLQY